MGKIPIQIGHRNFELIRNNIGAILAFELADQTETVDVNVYAERNIPYDLKELPAVNVSFDNNSNVAQTTDFKRNENTYFVDVIVSGKHTNTEQGDELANLKCQRICGIIDYILSSPEYYNLDFDLGLIETSWVSDINIGRLQNQDSKHSVVGRLTFKVRAREDVQQIEGTPGEIIGVTVKINETEKGHKFELITSETVEVLTNDTVLTNNTILT